MKKIDLHLLRQFSLPGACEWCGVGQPEGRDPHHIFSKGAGRVDIRRNLISLCRPCHSRVHAGHITKFDLLAVVARRERCTPEAIVDEVQRIRRTAK